MLLTHITDTDGTELLSAAHLSYFHEILQIKRKCLLRTDVVAIYTMHDDEKDTVKYYGNHLIGN